MFVRFWVLKIKDRLGVSEWKSSHRELLYMPHARIQVATLPGHKTGSEKQSNDIKRNIGYKHN